MRLSATIIRKSVGGGSIDIVEIVGDLAATAVGDSEVRLLDEVSSVIESEVGDIDDGRCSRTLLRSVDTDQEQTESEQLRWWMQVGLCRLAD